MRRRILLAILAATTVAVVLFAVPLGFTLADLYRKDEVTQLERTAADAINRVPTSFPRTLDPIELPAYRGGRTVALYGTDGARVAGSGPTRADAAVRAALRGRVSDDESGGFLVVGIPVTRGERVVGALRAASPREIVTTRTREAILVMLAIGAVAIGASGLLAAWQSRRLARPVRRLARDAARLGDGDFTLQTQVSGIPEIDAASHALAVTAARLDRMLSRERSFSEDASHQLRTPLTSLRITLESASIDERSEHKGAISAALEEVDRLERTIDDLLSLAREQRDEAVALDVSGLLTALDDDWHGRLAASGRLLRVIADSDLPLVAISDRALRQILDVLVDNARRHGSGIITMRARLAPNGVVIEVTDEGEGIAEDAGDIFSRRAGTPDGHGIGLALARSLAEAENASLRVERSRPQPIFTVSLPASRLPPL